MKPKVVVYKKIPESVLSYIKKTCHVSYFENLEDYSNPNFLKDLKDAEGLLGKNLKINRELLDHAPLLKVISNLSVGYNNFDMEEISKRGILATNTPDVLTETTADLIFGLILSTARRISELDNYVKSREWNKLIGEEHFGVDIHRKVLGIIGMGRIGTAIAKRANLGFDMDILYHNRSRNETAEELYQAKMCTLEELLSRSDFVCLMTPLTSETEHLMNVREFGMMKPSAIFINGSRGETVNEAALYEALKHNKILGAGLDVYDKEPINPDHPFLDLKNVVTLPHIGSATMETKTKIAWLAAENLLKGVVNEKPPSLINKEVFIPFRV